MKTLLLVALLATLSSAAGLVQSKVCASSTATSTTCTFTNPVTAGDTIVVEAMFAYGYTYGESDTLANSYTRTDVTYTHSSGALMAWYSVGVVGGTDSVKITTTGTGSQAGIWAIIMEFNGPTALDTYGITGTNLSNAGTASMTVTTSASVTQSNELIVGLFADWDNAPTWSATSAGTGYTSNIRTSTNPMQYSNTSTGDAIMSEYGNATTGWSGNITTTASKGSGNINDTYMAINLAFKLPTSTPIRVIPQAITWF